MESDPLDENRQGNVRLIVSSIFRESEGSIALPRFFTWSLFPINNFTEMLSKS